MLRCDVAQQPLLPTVSGLMMRRYNGLLRPTLIYADSIFFFSLVEIAAHLTLNRFVSSWLVDCTAQLSALHTSPVTFTLFRSLEDDLGVKRSWLNC